MPARITILLALYNGAAHLEAQLESLAAQTEQDWALVVSDDGSTDTSPGIVARWQAAAPPGKITLIDGPRRGSAANFLHLLARAPAEAQFTALCDQDDVWLPHKLARARAALEGISGPAACFSRTLIVAGDLSRPRPSRPLRRPGAFGNALVQNVMPGNTIMLNQAALRQVQAILAELGPEVTPMLHDWWLYQVLTGIGARLVHDAKPSLLYRQHAANIVGANDGATAWLRRLRQMLDGTHHGWTTGNLALLTQIDRHLTEESRAQLALLMAARAAGTPLGRLRGVRAAGVWRQTPGAQLALMLAALLGRL